MQTNLTHVDPDRHMDRWYSVAIQPTLLDEVAVVCIWGSRRSRYQRCRVLSAVTRQEARDLARHIVRAKVRRGYQVAG